MSVFTKVSHAELLAFLDRYALGELIGFQGIGEGVENTNYFVDTTDGRFVLTLFERLNYEDLPFFIGLMEHLAARGFPSPMPQHTRDGETLTVLNDKPAALVHRLTGQSVLFASAYQCAQVGGVLADMHLLGQTYEPRVANARGGEWRRQTGGFLAARSPHLEISRLIEDELAAQGGLEMSALPQGVIHADLFRDNVLFVDERLTGVIDFYYACEDALLYDLAVTVNDWCVDHDGTPNASRWSALVGAYRAKRPFSDAERAAWPLVVRAAALRFWLSRLYDWMFPRAGDVVHVKDPEQYRRILEHHRRTPPPPL